MFNFAFSFLVIKNMCNFSVIRYMSSDNDFFELKGRGQHEGYIVVYGNKRDTKNCNKIQSRIKNK